jgi:hypothetical protein
MPKRINPQDQWETDFLVPLPGEPRNIGPLETLFQKLLNRTERLKSRISAILGLPWDATPPETLAGLAGRVSTLETNQGGTTLANHRTALVLDHPDGSVTTAKLANGAVTLQKLASTSFSADPAPNTLVLRNSQGAVQDGASAGPYNVLRIGGIYAWRAPNKWLRLARWVGFSSPWQGLFADLNIIRVENENLQSRLRASLSTNENGQVVNPLLSLAIDHYQIIKNAVLVQVAVDTVELWAYFRWGNVYVTGTIGLTVGTPVLTPYGDVASIVQDAPPTAVPGGTYLEWATATTNQTFPGPGYIVAAARGTASGYVRYDNGVQVAWATITLGSGSWVFPAAFASPPQVQATAQDSAPRLVTITSVSTTAAEVLRTDLTGATRSGTVHLYAVGLWKQS